MNKYFQLILDETFNWVLKFLFWLKYLYRNVDIPSYLEFLLCMCFLGSVLGVICSISQEICLGSYSTVFERPGFLYDFFCGIGDTSALILCARRRCIRNRLSLLQAVSQMSQMCWPRMGGCPALCWLSQLPR